jgi:DNA polymerase
LDPTTQVLCLAYRLPYWETGRTEIWNPAFPHLGIDAAEAPIELFEWIQAGEPLEAHNAWMERGVWTNIMVPQFQWPQVPHRSWRCSAAKAAAHTLPRGIDKACAAMRLSIGPDIERYDRVKKMWSPRKSRKAERTDWARKHAPCAGCEATGKIQGINPDTGRSKKMPCPTCEGLGYNQRCSIPDMPLLWHESRELFEDLFAYCRQDVLAEEALSDSLPDLDEMETEIFLLDMAINERGFPLDTEAVNTALELLDGEFTDLNRELFELTGGQVEKATQRAKMLTWLAEEGLELENSQADTLDDTLKRDGLQPNVRRGLELMRALGRSSTAKYEAMRDWVCPDSRVHGGLLYHGASTGRWSGKGVQPHNFPRLTLIDQQDLDDKGKPQAMDPELIWALLKTKDKITIEAEFGGVMEALSGALRGAIATTDDKQLYVADFNAIECRVLFWAADDEEGLKIFREGLDPYNDMATTIYGFDVNRKIHKTEGQIGKVAILGLGYQMGSSKYVQTVFDWTGLTIPEDIYCANCKGGWKEHQRREHECLEFEPIGDPKVMTGVKVVDAYRTRFSNVRQMWRDQEEAAIYATVTGKPAPCGKVLWEKGREHDFLYCTLPSGRRLAYPEPMVKDNYTSWGELKPQLSYMGVDTYTKQWRRQTSYGGLIVENIVQAISRDLMALALLRLENHGRYLPILSVHDEGLSEADKGTGSVEEFVSLITELPDWAEGLPMGAAGWTGSRYKKD